MIRHIEGNRYPVGELDGSESERVQAICNAFVEAGFKSFVLPDIRSEIWLKLWGNLSFNPISALTHSTLVDICQFPQTRALAAQMMTEAQQIAEKLGASFRVSLERRIEELETLASTQIDENAAIEEIISGVQAFTDVLADGGGP